MDDVPYIDTLYVRGICSRPIIPDFLPDKSFNEDSDKAAIYWLDIENGADGNYFLNLCMMYLLDYIRQMKASLQLPNISIDILNNVDAKYMQVSEECQNYALQSGWKGKLLI